MCLTEPLYLSRCAGGVANHHASRQGKGCDRDLRAQRRRSVARLKGDDGIGFDIKRTRTRAGLGYAGMNQRVRTLGGRLGMRSEQGRGTTISAWVPLGVITS